MSSKSRVGRVRLQPLKEREEQKQRKENRLKLMGTPSLAGGMCARQFQSESAQTPEAHWEGKWWWWGRGVHRGRQRTCGQHMKGSDGGYGYLQTENMEEKPRVLAS